MTPSFKKLKLFMNREFIHDKFCITLDVSQNKYSSSNTSMIPKNTYIKCDFCCDSGLYGIADIDGVLYKVLIPLNDIHKLEVIENTAKN